MLTKTPLFLSAPLIEMHASCTHEQASHLICVMYDTQNHACHLMTPLKGRLPTSSACCSYGSGWTSIEPGLGEESEFYQSESKREPFCQSLRRSKSSNFRRSEISHLFLPHTLSLLRHHPHKQRWKRAQPMIVFTSTRSALRFMH